ncbi:unnamed protein product [Ceutorhynchus assimilis]|uniref:SAM domain-containing protein n=1 Tax=Ceutorhynchus assimilis TaxID=467358 RepID=A0A9N9QQD6_9CUCU|nr:unnamed protein product [Ceutorhynchus assimilis]
MAMTSIGNITKVFSFPDLSWSRFGSLPLRKSRLAKENGVSLVPKPKHKDISQWLKDLELEEYAHLFAKFQGVEDILEFSETDLKDLGVKKSSHRATIISSLTLLRAKYHESSESSSNTSLEKELELNYVDEEFDLIDDEFLSLEDEERLDENRLH